MPTAPPAVGPSEVRTPWRAGCTRRRRRLVLILVAVVVIGGATLVHLDAQHRFAIRTEAFTFESGDDTLAATLHLPTGDGPHGVVVFVPGDGTDDAGPETLPVWEALARAGYATVTWDKPGVRTSTGNWLDQSMDDRADEVIDVLDALADRPDVDVTDIGVIGASQGGWVIPLVAERIDVDFLVAWSTAISWTEQGRYFTERRLDGVDPELAERVRQASRSERGDTYRQYIQWYGALDPDVRSFFAEMTEDRWSFVMRNQHLDARDTLHAMRGTPVLLLLGEDDTNVDVDHTERVYREILGGPCLEVIRYPGADHALLDRDGFSLTITAIFRPRAIFADGLLDDIERFAASPHDC